MCCVGIYSPAIFLLPAARPAAAAVSDTGTHRCKLWSQHGVDERVKLRRPDRHKHPAGPRCVGHCPCSPPCTQETAEAPLEEEQGRAKEEGGGFVCVCWRCLCEQDTDKAPYFFGCGAVKCACWPVRWATTLTGCCETCRVWTCLAAAHRAKPCTRAVSATRRSTAAAGNRNNAPAPALCCSAQTMWGAGRMSRAGVHVSSHGTPTSRPLACGVRLHRGRQQIATRHWAIVVGPASRRGPPRPAGRPGRRSACWV